MQLSQIPVQTPTPFYYYNLELLKKTVQAAKSESAPYGYRVHYAVKANANPVLLRLISQQGLGADCVSGNEIRQALECGFAADTIVYAGVGKSDAEIELALQHDIFCFNCESLPEIQVIDGIAARLGKKARIALRINPNVDAHTHHYITTGIEENKFGIYLYDLEHVITEVAKLKQIELIGLHFHIGSQITDMTVFRGLCIRANEIQRQMKERGLLRRRVRDRLQRTVRKTHCRFPILLCHFRPIFRTGTSSADSFRIGTLDRRTLRRSDL